MTMKYVSRKSSNRKSGRTRTTVTPHNREYYTGANQTRNSICNNPGAYSSPTDPLFGNKTFGRHTFMPSEDVLDAAAERQINGGYSRTKNKFCNTCFVQMPNTNICSYCD